MVAHFTSPILELWYMALNSPHGIAIQVTDFARARGKFYAARVQAMDQTLEQVSLCQSPTKTNEIWLVKKGPKAA